ncbi:MAG: hypothetical protein HOQ24_18680, partial [Mycobacteriaceae bacterium]|nr:hypothetical protein [Mycobacteriaceae bacterium]
MNFALVYGTIGAFALAVFCWRLWLTLRAPRRPELWAVAVAILLSAVGFEAAVPRIYTAIGDAAGVPNLATLVVYGAIAGSVLAQLVWTTFMVSPGDVPLSTAVAGSARRTLQVGAAALTVMTALFALAPVHDRTHATDFDYHYSTTVLVDLFLAVYLAVYTVALAWIIRLCRVWLPQVRGAGQAWLRRGLRLLGIGSVIALGYSAGKVIAVVGAWFGADFYDLNVSVAPAFASLGASVMLVGYLFPSFVPRIAAAGNRIRATRRLRPLWRALRDIAPELAAPARRRPGH